MIRYEYNTVWSGSGDKLATQIGAWLTLYRYIKPLVNIGTSGGSITASFIALDYSILQIQNILKKIDICGLTDYYYFQPFSLLDSNKMALMKGEKLLNVLKEIFPYQFKDTKFPLVIVTTELETNNIKIFGTKETPDVWIYDAIRASISLPFFFTPHIIEGKHYVDGGLSENFFLRYFSPNTDNILGVRCVDNKEENKIDSIKKLMVFTLFSAIVKNEEQNIKEYPKAKILELVTSTDNFELDKLNYKALCEQVRFGQQKASMFIISNFWD